MAFPQVLGLTEQVTASGTSHAIDLPATVGVGDLLVLLARTVGPDITPPADWSEEFNQLNSLRGAGYVHLCDGTEDGGTATFTTASSAVMRTFIYHISAASWYKNLD